MSVRLPIHTYLAVGALSLAGLLSVVSPAAGSATIAPGSCAPTPEVGAVKLVVAPGSVAAGQRVHFRVDNTEGPTITYGAEYGIQECVAGVWRLAPFSPTAATRQRIRQRRGRGRWWSAPISDTAATGQYRIRKLVEVERSSRWLYGDFDVAAPTSARQAGLSRNPLGASQRRSSARTLMALRFVSKIRTLFPA